MLGQRQGQRPALNHQSADRPPMVLILRTLMPTTVDILCFCWHLYNQLLKIKYASSLETLIYGGTEISQIAQIFSHLKLWIAVARYQRLPFSSLCEIQLQVAENLNFLTQCSKG